MNLLNRRGSKQDTVLVYFLFLEEVDSNSCQSVLLYLWLKNLKFFGYYCEKRDNTCLVCAAQVHGLIPGFLGACSTSDLSCAGELGSFNSLRSKRFNQWHVTCAHANRECTAKNAIFRLSETQSHFWVTGSFYSVYWVQLLAKGVESQTQNREWKTLVLLSKRYKEYVYSKELS